MRLTTQQIKATIRVLIKKLDTIEDKESEKYIGLEDTICAFKQYIDFDLGVKLPMDKKATIEQSITMAEDLIKMYTECDDMSNIELYDQIKKKTLAISSWMGDLLAYVNSLCNYGENCRTAFRERVCEVLMAEGENKTNADKLSKKDDRYVIACNDLAAIIMVRDILQYKLKVLNNLYQSAQQSVSMSRANLVSHGGQN